MIGKTPQAQPGLNRVLGLRELVLYGIILDAAHRAHALVRRRLPGSHGHVVTTMLIGMVAMLFTAISYGRMAKAYPSAGSAYTYVGRELHPALGYLTGWAMIFDYVINPIICVIWCSKAAMNSVPELPYAVWAVGFAVLFTLLNLRGIQASARTNHGWPRSWALVIVAFFAAVIRNLWLHAPDRHGRPFPAAVLRPGDVFRGAPCPPALRLPCSPTSASTASRRSPRKPIIRGETSCWPPC